MRFSNLLQPVFMIVAIVTLAMTTCKKQEDLGANYDKAATAAWSKPTAVVPTDAQGKITSNLTLTNDKVWLLNGVVYVTNNAKLTINPGTVVSAGAYKSYPVDTGFRDIRGVLVITKGSTIHAVGSASQPIVFTSPNDPCSRKAGDFGGVVLLGRAPINADGGSDVIEGIPPLSPPADITYGGNTATDNSGRLEWVRIEYPGFKLDKDNEINGLTLGGVGSGTVLNHIQVSYSADDAFEFFGGTVNAKHLVALGTDDDDFDFDQGYRGNIQWAIGLKDPNSTHSKSSSNPTQSDANGIESDNNADGTTTTLITRPVISNLTLLGFNSNSGAKQDTLLNGARLRRATQFVIKNSVIAGYPNAARFESTQTLGYTSPNAIFSHNVVQAYNSLYNPATSPSYVANNNQLLTSPSSTTAADAFIKLGYTGSTNRSPFYIGGCPATYSTDYLYPQPNPPFNPPSPALSGANWTNLPAFFTQVTYRGAIVPSDNWTAGWVNWNPHDTDY